MLKAIRKSFASYCALARAIYPARPLVDYPMLCKLLYLRDDIARHLKKMNYIYNHILINNNHLTIVPILFSIPEFPILKRMKEIVETYSFSAISILVYYFILNNFWLEYPGMCTICLQKYTRCSHLCASCSVNLQGQPCPFCNKWSHFSNELHTHVAVSISIYIHFLLDLIFFSR